jgi:YVTN family beta-propeller protein
VGRRCLVPPDDGRAGGERAAGPRERERTPESMNMNGIRAKHRAGRRTAAVLAVAGLAMAGTGLAAQAASAATTFSVTATIGVGASPEWVAVDPETGTAYVTNENNTVSVIDEATDQVTATIAVGADADPFGVAVDPDTGTVYVTNSGNSTVSVIDGATNQVTATIAIPVGIDRRTGGERSGAR